MRRKDREGALDILVGLATAGMLFCESMGCGSSAGSPVVADASPDRTADASPDRTADSSIATDAGPVPDTSIAAKFCTAPATGTLIDDMSGSSISLPPSPCGWGSVWTVDLWSNDPASTGSITVPPGNLPVLQSCGSGCQSVYSPLPAGFPGPIATTADGGASGPQAMCLAGQTGASGNDGAGVTLELADTVWPPRGLIDASEYGGIQFWLWVSPDTATSVSSSFLVQLIDKNQDPGGGVCNENSNGITACAGAQAGNSGSVTAENYAAGPLFADEGSGLTSLSGGWQHVRAPWSSFVPNPAWGGANEQTVDPRTLAAISFFVVKESPRGGAIPFDYCIYQLSFLPKAEVPGLDGGAVLDGGVQSAADSGAPVDVQLAQD